MNAQQVRVLGIIADLEAQGNGREVDELAVAQECGAVAATLPRHTWMSHPCRGDLLRVLTHLDHQKLIYVTRRGYWGLHTTQRGRAALAAANEAETLPANVISLPLPAPDVAPQGPAWEAPRPAAVAYAPRQDYFYNTVALVVMALGALMLFAFGQSSLSPLARHSAAAPLPPAATPVRTVPVLPTATPTPAAPTPTIPANRAFTVANTGGDGVYLRRAPQTGERLTAWPDSTRLAEIGPEQTVNGVVWRQVRAPDGSEGFVPAQYTTVAP